MLIRRTNTRFLSLLISWPHAVAWLLRQGRIEIDPAQRILRSGLLSDLSVAPLRGPALGLVALCG